MTRAISIGVPPRQRLFHLERLPDDECWRLWIAADPTRMRLPTSEWHGTFLLLHDDGAVDRITVGDDEPHDRSFRVKGPDK